MSPSEQLWIARLMIESSSEKRIYEMHASLCQTLANPKRLHLLDVLRDGELSVNELVQATGLPQANVSQHLSLLRDRGVVDMKRTGNTVYCRLATPKIIKAYDLIREVLLDRLAESRQLAKQITRSAL